MDDLSFRGMHDVGPGLRCPHAGIWCKEAPHLEDVPIAGTERVTRRNTKQFWQEIGRADPQDLGCIANEHRPPLMVYPTRKLMRRVAHVSVQAPMRFQYVRVRMPPFS